MTDSVSIIIPCKEIDGYTKECIESCKKLDYTDFEIILLPDYVTVTIDDVIIIETGPVSPGAKRNIGIQNARGDFCAFIDNDAYPRRDWLRNALTYLRNPSIAGVGGPGVTPDEDDLMQRAGGYVLSSFMVGNLSSRYKTKSCFESDDIHSCNFIARKPVLVAAGGWNEKYWPGEDTLMCRALKKLGRRLVESSDVVVYHHRRSLFRSHIKQVSRFGEHRGFFVKRFPENSVKLTYFLPSLLLLLFFTSIFFSLLFSPFIYFTLIGLFVYLILSLIASVSQVKNIKLLFSVWSGIIVTHVVYGSFFLAGLVKRELKQ